MAFPPRARAGTVAPMRARLPTVAGGLRVLGLAGTAAGCVATIASLSRDWAVDGPREGHASAETGWQWLTYGDLLLVAASVLVLILATALCVGPRSRRVSRTAGTAAVAVLLLALAAIGVLYWLTGLDVSFFSDDSVRQYDPGPGFGAAVTGLGIALLGVLVLLAGRWDARTRRAIRRERTDAFRTAA
jgi:hypothetical protein